MTPFILAALMFAVLGVSYVKGYDLVKAKSPGHLPQFYLIMATVRMLLVLTLVGCYVLRTEDKEDVVHFVLACFGMYAMMMVVTLSMRH